MLTEQLKPFLDWLSLHPHWGGLITFFIAMGESLAVVGLLVPGSIIMAAVGALVGAEILPLVPTLLWGMAGAIIGDAISYWLGRHYQEQLREMWPFSRYPQWLDRGERFFQKHGGKSVFLGRFAGPVRPITPIIAGMLNMPKARFFSVDITSGILWAPAYMLPGIVLGAAASELGSDAATHLLTIMLVVLVFIALTAWFIKRFFFFLQDCYDRLFTRIWVMVKASNSGQWLYRLFRHPHDPECYSLFAVGFWFLVASISFYLLAHYVYVNGSEFPLNTATLHFFRSLRTNLMDQIMIGFTFFGEKHVLAVFWLAFLGYLAWKRYWWAAGHWFVAGVFCFLGYRYPKALVGSLRPSGLLIERPGYSFPSGHVALTVTNAFLFTALIVKGIPKTKQQIAFGCAAIFAVLMALSRIYIGVHWLTDVIGGLFFALSGILLLILSYYKRPSASLPIKSTCIFAAIAVTLSWALSMCMDFKNQLHDYQPFWPVHRVNVSTWWDQNGKFEPFFVVSRTGKPIALFNLQWVGNIDKITQRLYEHGWKNKPASLTLKSAVAHLTDKSPVSKLPLIPRLYQNHKPILRVIQHTDDRHKILVLRLWRSNLFLQNTNKPMWIGSLTYFSSRNNQSSSESLDERIALFANQPDPTKFLQPALGGLKWKLVTPNVAKNQSNATKKLLLIWQE